MQDRFKFKWFSKKYKKIFEVACLEFPDIVVYIDEDGNEVETSLSSDYGELIQCTGLKDKNGKLIFEGDILTDGYYNMLVYYDQENCSFALQKRTKYTLKRFGKNGYERISLRNLSENSFKNHQLKILGNVYENPELLEDK